MNLLTLDYTPAATQFATNMTAFQQLAELLLDQALHQTLDEAAQIMDTTVPVDTGALRDSRTPVVRGSLPLTWETSYPLPYAATLEYGGYPGVGPKTVALGGGPLGDDFMAGPGIYAQQAPLGWVRRALAAVRGPLSDRALAAVGQAWRGEVQFRPSTSETAPSGGLSEIFGIELG